MKARVAVLGALAAVVLAAPARACPLPVAYPGDGAAEGRRSRSGWRAARWPPDCPASCRSWARWSSPRSRTCRPGRPGQPRATSRPGWPFGTGRPTRTSRSTQSSSCSGSSTWPPRSGRPTWLRASTPSRTPRCGATGSPTCWSPPSNTAGATSCAWPRRGRSSAPRAPRTRRRAARSRRRRPRARPRRRHDRSSRAARRPAPAAPAAPRRAARHRHLPGRGVRRVGHRHAAAARPPPRAAPAREAGRAGAGSDAHAAPRAQPAGAVAIRRALRAHRALKAKLLVKVADAIGNEATSARTCAWPLTATRQAMRRAPRRGRGGRGRVADRAEHVYGGLPLPPAALADAVRVRTRDERRGLPSRSR